MSLSSAQILVESLEKKSRILDEIIKENEAQEVLLKQDELDMEALDASADRMGELAEKLELLDEGFEAVYDRIRQELIDNKSAYRGEIRRMQELIAVITEKVVGINAARMRNKTQAENQFKKSRQQIGKATSKMKVSQNYYNNMNRLNYVGPQFYDKDTITDQPERQIVAELIREQALQCLEDEIPHGIAVMIEQMKERKKSALMDIEAVIICERQSHKGIIIGKKGSMLKRIGTKARKEIEALLDIHINLKLWVKVRKEWRDNDIMLKNYGYNKKEL